MGRSTFEQLEPFPSLERLQDEVGLLHFEPDELTDQYAIEFVRDYDDLDYFEISVIRLQSGRLVGLRRYRGSPPGTVVLLDRTDDYDAARDELVRALNLSKESLTWINQERPS